MYNKGKYTNGYFISRYDGFPADNNGMITIDLGAPKSGYVYDASMIFTSPVATSMYGTYHRYKTTLSGNIINIYYCLPDGSAMKSTTLYLGVLAVAYYKQW